jgi:hypothetical protein
VGKCCERFLCAALAVTLASGLAAASTMLGVRETRFTLNDQPTFLLGISYYGALGASEEFIRADLDDMQRSGFNWMRVWATWAAFDEDVSAVDAQGQPREPFLGRLKWLVAECDRRGLAVDVTLTRGKGAGSVPDFAAHRTAVETLVNALREHRNWYLDLANERDVGDARFVSLEELRDLRRLVRTLDSQRLVTASFGGHDLGEAYVRDALITTGLDFVSPHRPRRAGSPAETADQTREVLAAMRAVGRTAPVHYQEPFRRGYGQWEPVAADFLTDLRGAVEGGAAGWCLHNGSRRGTDDGEPRRSFDLRKRRLFAQLDEEERKVAAQARFIVNGLPRLRVSENGRFLVQEDGTPFFWLGDTAWWIRRLKPEDVEFYLARRAQQGFNVIQVHPGYREADYAGNRPFLEDDPARPNEAFWRNMDAIVASARDHGLYVALVPMWGAEYGKAFGTDAAGAKRFGEWIGGRYRAMSNVLWIVSGEYDSINGFRLPISPDQKSVLAAVGEGLRSAHGGAQLMTVHPGAARTSSLDFHDAPWLDFNMLQSGHAIDCEAFGMAENHALIAHDYALAPAKPVLDGEPIYEDTPDGIWIKRDVNAPRADGHAVRAKAYWAVFAGAFGHTYGHNDVYGFHEPPTPGHVVQLPEGPGQRGSWRIALDAEGATQMVHLRDLMESRPFLDRIPDPSLVAGDAGKGLDHVVATRGSDGSYAMVYIPRARPVKIALGGLSGERVRVWWYDPRTGAAQAAGECDRRGEREFTPSGGEDGQDWVLVLDDAERDFPPPGTRR